MPSSRNHATYVAQEVKVRYKTQRKLQVHEGEGMREKENRPGREVQGGQKGAGRTSASGGALRGTMRRSNVNQGGKEGAGHKMEGGVRSGKSVPSKGEELQVARDGPGKTEKKGNAPARSKATPKGGNRLQNKWGEWVRSLGPNQEGKAGSEAGPQKRKKY